MVWSERFTLNLEEQQSAAFPKSIQWWHAVDKFSMKNETSDAVLQFGVTRWIFCLLILSKELAGYLVFMLQG